MFKFKKIVALFLFFPLSTKIFAWGVVSDPVEHSLTNTVIAKDLAMIEKLRDQITHLQDIHKSIDNNLSGLGHMGSILNDNATLQNRITNSSWDDALRQISGGNVSRYNALKGSYEKRIKLMDPEQFQKGVDEGVAKSYKLTKDTTEASSINAEAEFNNITQEINNIHELSKKIDTAKTQKEISDLNARLTVELAYLQAESLRMQAIQNKQLSAKAAKELAAESFESEYTTYHKED